MSENALDLTERSPIEKRIVGGIVGAVDAHGPITRENVASAAKRVYGELKAEARRQRGGQESASPRRSRGTPASA